MSTSLPTNFRSVISDFVNDLSITFSDYSYLWSKWSEPELSEIELRELFDYCLKVYPERFFDILYQNEDIFSETSNVNIYFLPKVSFKFLFHCEGITEKTKKAIWKYLQLILFTIVGGIKDKTNFGDAMNLFQGIDEGELQEKLKDTMSGITDFFSNMEAFGEDEEEKNTTEGANNSEEPVENNENNEDAENFGEKFKNMFENMKGEGFEKMGGLPNMENIKEHLKTLFDGKIGKLAKELADEISGEFSDLLGEDVKDARNTQDVIKKLMKNPKLIMDLLKKVSGKLDSKMKNGDISRDELMKEAGDLLSKMKDMGGQEQFNEMFKKMASSMGGLGKNMKLDTNALDRLTKQASMRDKMKAKMEVKKQQQMEEIEKKKEEIRRRVEEQQRLSANYSLNQTSLPNNFVFRLEGEESQEKSSANSFIHPDLLKEMESVDSSSKKKKNKKKK